MDRLAGSVQAGAAGTTPWSLWAAAVCGAAQALCLRWGSVADGDPPRQLLALLTAAAIGTAALIWIVFSRQCDGWPWRRVLLVALLPRLMLLEVAPLLEDDHHRYLWDGWRTLAALDPYRLPPAAYFGDAAVDARLQDALGGINNPHLPTIYGAVPQWLFALAAAIAPGSLIALKLLLAGIDVAVLALLARLGLSSRWLLLYALHPLALREVSANAHPDALLALWLLCALWCWRRSRPLAMGAMLGLALATKVAAIVALPLLLARPFASRPVRRCLLAACATAATLAVLSAPLLIAGGSELASLRTFASQWRFNPLLYRAFEALGPAALARAVAATVLAIVIGMLMLHTARREASGPTRHLPALDAALGALLMCAPVVNPWYWLWVLPLALACGRHWAAAAACVACLSYLNGSALPAGGWLVPAGAAQFAVAWPVAAVQIAVVAFAGAGDVRSAFRNEQGVRDSAMN